MGRPQPTPAAARRKQLGAWYTPDALVDHLVALTLPSARTRTAGVPLRVLDPACGDGAFLHGVRRVLGHAVELVGVDVDPSAVAAARVALPEAELIVGDALAMEWGARRFDVVIGNPPFLNQMARATTRGGSSRFGGGPYADAAAEFLALSISLAEPVGGRVGLVLPQSILTSRDAGPIRAAALERSAMVHAWWSTSHVFDAAVYTCALVFERGATQGAVERTFGLEFAARDASPLRGSWGALVVDESFVAEPSGGAVLGDIATFAVDFRDQYYGLIGAVGDDVDGPPLITSGLIEPGRCLWGERPVRFGKQRFEAPRVALDRLTPKLQRWAELRLVPKILIANQTKVIEAVIDRAGAWLPSVPTITCTPRDAGSLDAGSLDAGSLDAVFRVLSSPAASAWVRHHAAGSGLSATSLRLSPALLASIPLPSPLPPP
jgi:methylase of polypeptide subunit release factors